MPALHAGMTDARRDRQLNLSAVRRQRTTFFQPSLEKKRVMLSSFIHLSYHYFAFTFPQRTVLQSAAQYQ
jgi:hypothetical protein